MKEPKVLTRMRLCECWGDILNIEELKEVNNYITNLQQKIEEYKNQQKEFIEYLKEMLDSEIGVFAEVKVCDFE